MRIIVTATERPTMRIRQLAPAAVAVVGLVLAGCSSPIDTSDAVRVDDPAPTTISGLDLALAAEGVVAEQGFDVVIDCGTDDVPLEVGTSVECAGVDTASGAEGSYTVTIVAVDGADYEIEVVGSEAQPAEPSEPASAFESAANFAGLVASLVTEQTGEEATVDCGTADIEIFVGQEVRCGYETASFMGTLIATVTEFDGSNYSISVVDE